MTTERIMRVRIPAAARERFELLTRQADYAAHRLAESALGDRTELIRFEQIVSQIETIAYSALVEGSAQTGDTDGPDVISVAWPFVEGVRPTASPRKPSAGPAEIWRSTDERASRTDATYQRLFEQLASWADPVGGSSSDRTAVCPSDCQNRALTEALRAFVGAKPGHNPVDAPIIYRDGSSARDFPLRSVLMSGVEPDDGREIVRMTLLSVRHLDMDVKVDGAWLRNREISLRRAGALTDELVYQQSLQQFAIISADGPVTLHLYQTGLAPANVGFYRALLDHHRRPGNRPAVAVVPFYYVGGEFARSKTTWTIQ